MITASSISSHRRSLVVSKRLYAFRDRVEMIGIVILVLTFAVSCTYSESTDKAAEVITQDLNESEDVFVNDAAIDYAQHDVFVSELVPNEDRRLVSTYEGDYWAQLPLESARISMGQVFTYDASVNGYTASFNLIDPITYSIRSSLPSNILFHIVDNKIVGDYSDRISPNMRTPIFKTGDFYVSTYENRMKKERSIIYSSDLINWHQSGVMYPWVPILLYEKNGGLFALAGRQVWDVSDPRHARLSRELEYTIMPPKLPIKPRSRYVRGISYCFNINNHLVMYITTAFGEKSIWDFFQIINLNDFSRKTAASDGEVWPSIYKAVKREDGWKIYHIGLNPADGIIVLDPFAPDGPAIIERLPGVNLPESVQQ